MRKPAPLKIDQLCLYLFPELRLSPGAMSREHTEADIFMNSFLDWFSDQEEHLVCKGSLILGKSVDSSIHAKQLDGGIPTDSFFI